ncbi:hypothetical protein RFI_29409 [Reticulomyxa filosa]|uniref:Uncharacterized protein n=1 Tax=Reticulomyxa filosa TaxID=46433 RepID=X6M2Y6_RETFI|nr:hypothetical protein RFI_29409 [Reticulomyxa filosa]|eukprot:ETO07981.1 hypothetical protein RFI_29409 [Reticulomyxa filosa]
MQLQNSIWEFFEHKSKSLDDEIFQLELLHDIFALKKLYLNKENMRTLRAKKIMNCFTCKKSDDTLMCLNALTDKQISHDRSKPKTLMEQLLRKAESNLSKEMHALIKECMNGRQGKDLITSCKNELLYVIKQITQNPIAQLHLQNFDPIQQQTLRKLFEDEKSVSQSDLELWVDILLPITSDDTFQQQRAAAMNRIKTWMQQRRLVDQGIYLEMTQQIAKINSDMIDIPFICN